MTERTPLELVAFAAWVNCPVDKLPELYKQHTCEATMVAWKRVVEAIQTASKPVLESNQPPCRARKPQEAVTTSTGQPAPFTPQDLDDRIDQICGCAGRWDCQCVSVFGQALSQLWYEHNSKPKE